MPKKAKHKSADSPATDQKLLPEQILAITRIARDKLVKAAREQVAEGQTFDVDFGLRITGQVSIGLATEYSSDSPPNPHQVIQALLAHFGPRKRKQVVGEILLNGLARTIAPDDEPVDGLEDLAEQLLDGLTVMTRRGRKGAVTGVVDAQLIEWSGR